MSCSLESDVVVTTCTRKTDDRLSRDNRVVNKLPRVNRGTINIHMVLRCVTREYMHHVLVLQKGQAWCGLQTVGQRSNVDMDACKFDSGPQTEGRMPYSELLCEKYREQDMYELFAFANPSRDPQTCVHQFRI